MTSERPIRVARPIEPEEVTRVATPEPETAGIQLFDPNPPTVPAAGFYLRGLALLSLTDIGHVGAGTVISDGGGGGTLTFNYGTAVPCRIDPLTSDESGGGGGRISDRSTHRVTSAPVDITVSSRFVIDGRGTFEVTAVDHRTGSPLTIFETVHVS